MTISWRDYWYPGKDEYMYEKTNPSHPDKVADRIAGALVDQAYSIEENPRIAVEVLLGHGHCYIIAETSVHLAEEDVFRAVSRIAGSGIETEYVERPQDGHLARNQKEEFRCGDNGIFKGTPVTEEQARLAELARNLYSEFPFDGKFIMDGKRTIICQSNASDEDIRRFCPDAEINPLGPWTGGSNVDAGATNRKLGSDMGDSITGGGLHGKDLSKADVSMNIFAFLIAQEMGKTVEFSCAIGDAEVDGMPYRDIVKIAHDYIKALGGFEKFAEWGLIR